MSNAQRYPMNAAECLSAVERHWRASGRTFEALEIKGGGNGGRGKSRTVPVKYRNPRMPRRAGPDAVASAVARAQIKAGRGREEFLVG
jgi:hypothetical protein